MAVIIGSASLGSADTVLRESDTQFSDTVTVPAGNKDRGLRLCFKVQGGPAKVSLALPGNGEQGMTEAEIKKTDAGRWSVVVIEADICTDEALKAGMKSSGGTIKDATLSLIEAAANRHYGDNVRIDYDRDLKLKVIQDGTFGVAGIEYDGMPVLDNKAFGEFSGWFENTSREFKLRTDNWKPDFKNYTLSDNGKTLTMTGLLRFDLVRAKIGITVVYEVINNHAIKKSITYRHEGGPDLFTSLDTFIGGTSADSFWTWQHNEVGKDGWIGRGENFLATGYRKGDVTVGLISDSGYLNQWNRVSRIWDNRPGRSGTTPSRNVADNELMGVFPSEKKAGFRLGRFYYLDDKRVESYQPLHPHQSATKVFFIMVDEELATARKRRLAVQTAFADGKAYGGSVVEKVLFPAASALTPGTAECRAGV